MTNKSREIAFKKWRKALGRENVLASSREMERYLATTLPKTHPPAAALKPGSVGDIIAVLKIASQHKIALYPISRGKNWGYGNAGPAGPGQVILDLSRMNKILEVNKDLAYAVIEPGVTQQDLHEHLEKIQSNLWMDATGAGPDASIIGNTVERGFGHSPLADHFHSSCGYEVILADGRIFTTGFGHYRNSRVTHIFKAGLGPSLDGLFTQSNLGVVTKMGIWLTPKPEKLLAYAFVIEDDEKLKMVIEALRPLRMQGILPSALHIANDLRIISGHQNYPWNEADGKTPMPDQVRELLRKQMTIGRWNGLGAIYGDRNTAAAAQKSIKQALKGIVRPFFIDESTLNIGKGAAHALLTVGWGNGLMSRVRAIEPVFDLLKGKPNREHLRGAFWRSKGGESLTRLDIDADKTIGLMWISPVIPMTKPALTDFLKIIEPEFLKFGFDPLITLTMLNARSLSSVLSINFDRGSKGERGRALKCYETLHRRLVDAGFIPYRAGIQSMNHLNRQSDVFWGVVRSLKSALDPKSIIAPNRYLPKG